MSNSKNKKLITPDMTKEQRDEAIAREIMEWIVSIIIAVAIVLVIFNYVGHMVKVDGYSMESTLHDGERVWCSRMAYKSIEDVSRGDIVITKYPNSFDKYVKRVIGLQGDTIEIRNSKLIINGVEIEEDYINEIMTSDFSEITVPEGCVFVMGDNRNHSRDSRYIGALDYEDMILGKVAAITWPMDRWEMVEHENYEELS